MSVREPSYRIRVNGDDITSRLQGRLITLTLTDHRGNQADELTLTLDDTDGLLALPPRGAQISLAIGWRDLLVDKGLFEVDELSHEGPPDQLTITARSANLRGPLRTKREQSWHQQALGSIVDTIASRHNLTSKVDPDLAGVMIEHIDQSGESDLHFLTRVARDHDAIATVKAGYLLLMPKGQSRSASGKQIPTRTLQRRDGDRHHYSLADRDSHYTGVIAYWQDHDAAQRQQVSAGDSEKAKVLPRTYPNSAAAQQAATAEWQRINRAGATLEITLAEGDPTLYPETPIKTQGYKAEIDATDWLLTKVVHEIGGQGYGCRLEMEVKGE